MCWVAGGPVGGGIHRFRGTRTAKRLHEGRNPKPAADVLNDVVACVYTEP